MGKGDKIYFWKDLWVGDCPLASTFRELFNCASNKEAKVIDYVEKRGLRHMGACLQKELK